MGNARYITKIDLSWAFHQVEVDPRSHDYTALSVPGRGQFRYKTMPFGLTNSPATYQEMIEKFIRTKLPPGAEDVIMAYLDDITLVTETSEEHLKWLEILLKALAEAQPQINPEKSEFCCTQAKYLGYIIDAQGLHADPEKVRSIVEYPAPTSLKQLRRFLGMSGWFSRFMENYSRDKAPLCHLLKKDTVYHWKPEQQKAFETIKDTSTETPVLIRPDFGKPFFLYTDASDYAIGAALTQDVDGYYIDT